MLDWQLVRWLGFLFLEYHGSNSSSRRLDYEFSNNLVLIIDGTGALGRTITKSFVSFNTKTTIASYVIVIISTTYDLF